MFRSSLSLAQVRSSPKSAQKLCAAAFLLCWVLIGGVQAQETIPGRMKGELDVSPGGAAVYRIPIDLPPGVAGMEPKLALTYNSQAGTGVMGQGWSIEGFSAISRCPKTMATDGVRGGLNYSADDRFCLDGQRLINVAGAYGAAGSAYRTEIDSFGSVIAVGAASGNALNGPESFTVRAKSGLTLTYGSTADSRIEAQGKSVVREWALSRMVDAKGNSIDFSYNEDTANGVYTLKAVSYAGGGVYFTYEDRPDKPLTYRAGSKSQLSTRLSQVETRVGDRPLLRYGITYLQRPNALRPSVRAISVCSVQPVTCRPGLEFDEAETQAGYSFSPLQVQAQNDLKPVNGWFVRSIHNRVWHVDMNADGLPDILGATDSGLYWQINNGAGFNPVQMQSSNQFRPADGWFSASIHNRVWVVDVNGDGLTDILGATDSGLYWQLGTGSGFGAPQMQALNAFKPSAGWFDVSIHNRMWVTDLNGDGLPDILGATDSGLYWQLNTGGGFGPTQMQAVNQFRPADGWFSTSIHNRVWVLDINADGLPDILGATDAGLYWQLNNGAGFNAPQMQAQNQFMPVHGWFSTTIHNRVWISDLNADGLPDILGATDSGLYWQLNTGNGFGAPQTQPVNQFNPAHGWFDTAIQPRVWVVDVNGDGFPDVLGATDAGLYWQLNTGTGFAQPQSQSVNAFTPAQGWFGTGIHSRVWITDLNGDGLPDILGSTDSGLYWQNGRAEASGRRPVSAVRSAGVDVALLAYRSVLRFGFDSSEAALVYPVQRVAIPLQAVSSLKRNDGVGGVSETTYSYGGLRAEQASVVHPGSGRGLLGFRWMKAREESTGVETYTEYSQSWPTIGQVIKSETRLAGAGNGGLLKQSTASYGCYQSAAAVGAATPSGATTVCGSRAPGKVYAPYLLSSVEDSWDLNGASMPRITTTNSFEGYADTGGTVLQWGDPTQIKVDIEHAGVLKQRKLTVNEYHPAKTTEGKWQLGRLKKATVISSQY